MDLMDGLQVVPVLSNAIKAVWAHPVLADVLESFGGPAVLDEGLRELHVGSRQVIADLLTARDNGVAIADAVFDPDSYPHLTRLHGRILDLMMWRVPDIWAPLLKTILRLRLPDDGRSFRCTVAYMAFCGMNAGECAFAQFILFEILCIHQRLELLRQKESLESLGGRRRDVEVLAQLEIEMPASIDDYRDDLLETEDPVASLVKIVTTSLLNHVDVLDRELKELRHLPRELEAVRAINEHMQHLEPDEALLFRNKTALLFGEQKMSPEQLQILHPIHLGPHSPENLYQKTHRATEKIKALSKVIEGDEPGRAVAPNQAVSLLDIILEVESEQSK